MRSAKADSSATPRRFEKRLDDDDEDEDENEGGVGEPYLGAFRANV
jgi:hypothetical protein